MNPNEIRSEDVDLIHLAQDRDRWRVYKRRWISGPAERFVVSRRTVLHGVSFSYSQLFN